MNYKLGLIWSFVIKCYTSHYLNVCEHLFSVTSTLHLEKVLVGQAGNYSCRFKLCQLLIFLLQPYLRESWIRLPRQAFISAPWPHHGPRGGGRRRTPASRHRLCQVCPSPPSPCPSTPSPPQQPPPPPPASPHRACYNIPTIPPLDHCFPEAPFISRQFSGQLALFAPTARCNR